AQILARNRDRLGARLLLGLRRVALGQPAVDPLGLAGDGEARRRLRGEEQEAERVLARELAARAAALRRQVDERDLRLIERAALALAPQCALALPVAAPGCRLAELAAGRGRARVGR